MLVYKYDSYNDKKENMISMKQFVLNVVPPLKHFFLNFSHIFLRLSDHLIFFISSIGRGVGIIVFALLVAAL